MRERFVAGAARKGKLASFVLGVAWVVLGITLAEIGFTLTACTPAQLATARTDLAAIEADADKLCAAVPTLVTVGDVANLLLPNLATTAALDVARAVQAKCVVVATARNDLAAGGSLSSTAVTLLSDPQAIADLASDVAAVKGAVAGGS